MYHSMERAKHSFLLCPILLSCLVMNEICLNHDMKCVCVLSLFDMFNHLHQPGLIHSIPLGVLSVFDCCLCLQNARSMGLMSG